MVFGADLAQTPLNRNRANGPDHTQKPDGAATATSMTVGDGAKVEFLPEQK